MNEGYVDNRFSIFVIFQGKALWTVGWTKTQLEDVTLGNSN